MIAVVFVGVVVAHAQIPADVAAVVGVSVVGKCSRQEQGHFCKIRTTNADKNKKSYFTARDHGGNLNQFPFPSQSTHSRHNSIPESTSTLWENTSVYALELFSLVLLPFFIFPFLFFVPESIKSKHAISRQASE